MLNNMEEQMRPKLDEERCLPDTVRRIKYDNNKLIFQYTGEGIYKGCFGTISKKNMIKTSNEHRIIKIDKRRFSRKELIKGLRRYFTNQNAILDYIDFDSTKYDKPIYYHYKNSMFYGALGKTSLNIVSRKNSTLGWSSILDTCKLKIIKKILKSDGKNFVGIDGLKYNSIVTYNIGDKCFNKEVKFIINNIVINDETIESHVRKFCSENDAKFIKRENGHVYFNINYNYRGYTIKHIMYRITTRSLIEWKGTLTFKNLTNNSQKIVAMTIAQSNNDSMLKYVPKTNKITVESNDGTWTTDIRNYCNRRNDFLWHKHASLGEEKVSKILDEWGIIYIRQKRIMINHELHIFDFVIPNCVGNSKNIFIEYNGKQHYEASGWTKENFPERLRRDRIKEQYVKNTGNKFIKIKYDEDDISGYLLDQIGGVISGA